MIIVGKKWDTGAVYVGRPGPLGNPFAMATEADRDAVCDRYAAYFAAKVAAGDAAVMNELRRLYRLHREHGTLVLGCYCAPKRCHADTIKAFLDAYS